MRNRDIVKKSWQMTQVHLKKLIWYAFVPAFLTIVTSSVYMMYQYEAFKNSPLVTGKEGDEHFVTLLGVVWTFVRHHIGWSAFFTVGILIFLLCRMVLPPMLGGALIEACNRINHFKPISGSFEVGVRKFFPMFEFAIISGSFSITTLFTESSFVLRWWGESVFFFILPILIFVAMVGLILMFLFTYAEFFIVLEGKSIIKAMTSSAVLVISNLKRTILVFILMMLIGARVIINVILVLLIPMILIGISTLFASSILGKIGLIIALSITFVLVLVGSYLLGLFHVFATSVWVITYSQLSHHGEHHWGDDHTGHSHDEGHGDAHGSDQHESADTAGHHH